MSPRGSVCVLGCVRHCKALRAVCCFLPNVLVHGTVCVDLDGLMDGRMDGWMDAGRAYLLCGGRCGRRWKRVCVRVVLQLWTAQPPLAEWIRRGQPAHTPPQRPLGAARKGRHKGRKQFSKPD
eukprot:359295-Chlamydomonas_euryale.AAC.8